VSSLRLTLNRASKGARRTRDQNPSASAFFAHALTFVLCGLPTATSNLQSPTSRVLRHVGPSKLASILLGSLAGASVDLQAEQRHNKTQTPVLEVRLIAPKSAGDLILLRPASSVRFSPSSSFSGSLPRLRRWPGANPMTTFAPGPRDQVGQQCRRQVIENAPRAAEVYSIHETTVVFGQITESKGRDHLLLATKMHFLRCLGFASAAGRRKRRPYQRLGIGRGGQAKRGMRLCGGRAVPDALHP
jgi:hypothetical protein